MLLPHRSSTVRLLAVAITVLVACTPVPRDDDPRAVKIAFFQDLSVPESLDLVSPSFLALDTVVQREVVGGEGIDAEVVQLDTGGDATTAAGMAREVAADPSFVLAVIAPFWKEPPEVARILAEAAVPTMSLSPESASPWLSAPSPPGDPAELWRRFVPGRGTQAELLARVARRSSTDDATQPVCLVGDGSDYGSELATGIEAALSPLSPTLIDGADASAAAHELASSGCGVVVWTGFPPGARDLAEAMREADPATERTIDLAGDALKAVMPLMSSGGEGVVVESVACPCADVSVALDLASRTFLNAYQSEHGLAPGVYAAEAWDAASIVAEALASGGSTRAGMRVEFRAITSYDGVAQTYTFDSEGEPIGARAGLFTAAGTRWLPSWLT